MDPHQVTTRKWSNHNHAYVVGSDYFTLSFAEAFTLEYAFDNVPTVVADVVTPEGGVVHWMIIVELRLIDKDGNELSDWFPERSLLREDQCMRLSGASMQHQLYYATAPSHQQLYQRGVDPI